MIEEDGITPIGASELKQAIPRLMVLKNGGRNLHRLEDVPQVQSVLRFPTE